MPGPPLTLADVAAAFDVIAATSGSIATAQQLRRAAGAGGRAGSAYLIKIATGDMRTGVKESVIEEALARQAGVPVGEVQAANMLLGDIGALAVRVRHGALAEVGAGLVPPAQEHAGQPHHQPPPRSIAAAGGRRAACSSRTNTTACGRQAHKQGDRVELYSRTLDPVTHRFPEVVAALAALPHDFILDGEVVAFAATAAGGRCLPFTALQTAPGPQDRDAGPAGGGAGRLYDLRYPVPRR